MQACVIQCTNSCPYNCNYCYTEKGDRYISLDVVKEILNLPQTKDVEVVQITGGEPLMHEDLSLLIKECKGNRRFVFLATSGYNHSREKYSELKKNGLDVLCISMNDIDKSINSLTRDTYDIGMAAIKDACDVGVLCCANVVLSDQNIDNFEKLSQYLVNIGVKKIDILRPVKSFSGIYSPTISTHTIQRIQNIIAKNPSLYRIEKCFKEYWEYTTNSEFRCLDIGESAIFINVDGTISPCSKLQKWRYRTIEEMKENEHEWKMGCR